MRRCVDDSAKSKSCTRSSEDEKKAPPVRSRRFGGASLIGLPIPIPPHVREVARSFGRAAKPASRGEWRTPPLWGVRDSGPYLHDGRAETLEQAIAFHEGEASSVIGAYFKLPGGERQAILRFLESLEAPTQVMARGEGREAPDSQPLGVVGLR